MIPKRIFTFWAGEQSDLIKKCIASQKIEGYEHRLITPDNIIKFSRYLNEAIGAEKLGVKRWCKVADWARLYYLFTEGGIYLDADVEIIPSKNFDDLLDNRMFVGLDNGYFASSVLGAEKGNPLLDFILCQVEDNFRGSGGWIWETGMKFFSEVISQHINEVRVLSPDYFFPYNHKNKEIKITSNTRTYHHFMGSWNY